ncbi:hypothetical protein [Hymenobacter qilianensis]|uniref:hypothetical protein n=1 Tax=Hymenobacter qilianensis TaxID=1385715 RepID=UPI001CB95AA8|nr:hypothetical protein [Hymenobacter qilianensis]
METLTHDKQQILQDNLDYTLFSWSKQAGLNPINAERAEGYMCTTVMGSATLIFPPS